jgi:CheY-like chemotaxis protein
VADTGIGIPVETQSTLFEKFVQADHSTTRRFGGTGLGLSISRDLIEMMGGSISFESKPGSGSTFRIILPFALASAHVTAVGPAAPRIVVPVDLPILVVEDNPINQKVISALLRSFEVTFELANDGLEAVDLCSRKEYAMVLMDCQMPRMDGFEATRRLRATGCRTPIIALTAATTQVERNLTVESGMNDFLAKPVTRNEISASLARWAPIDKTERVEIGAPQ